MEQPSRDSLIAKRVRGTPVKGSPILDPTDTSLHGTRGLLSQDQVLSEARAKFGTALKCRARGLTSSGSGTMVGFSRYAGTVEDFDVEMNEALIAGQERVLQTTPKVDISEVPCEPASFNTSLKSRPMNYSPESEDRAHSLTMHVFTVSAGMVGVCLTGIGLLRLMVVQTKVQTLGDDLLAVNAILFVICSLLAFGSLKTSLPHTRRRLRFVADVFFLAGLAGMGVICAVIAYAIF